MSPFAALGITTACIFLAVRFLEAPGNPATSIRVLMAILAVGYFLFARGRSIFQRTAVFVALEALGGFVAFTYVDVPFIVAHQAQIGQLSISLMHDLMLGR